MPVTALIGFAAPKSTPPQHYTSYPLTDSINPAWGPATLPYGTAVSSLANMQWGYFLSEDVGAGLAPDGKTAQQTKRMTSATDGFGAQTTWTYYPLSSAAGRTAGQTPLYTVPNSPSQRYVDDRDIYFTTSMPVVSDMTVSNGVGGTHALRYGYSQAMYQTHGRGFSGFRTIIEEDVQTLGHPLAHPLEAVESDVNLRSP